MKQDVDFTKTLEWLCGTIAVAAVTVFTVMRFAYSDFETQRTTDLYRSQMEARLQQIQNDIKQLNDKVDQLLERRR